MFAAVDCTAGGVGSGAWYECCDVTPLDAPDALAAAAAAAWIQTQDARSTVL